MFAIKLSKSAAVVLGATAALTVFYTAGIATGCYFYPHLFVGDHAQDHADAGDHAHADDDHEESGHLDHAAEAHEDVVVLTDAAVDNLGLQLGTVTRGDYWKSILVPAQVVEIPGRSNLTVSAPVAGVVEEVRVLPGESIDSEQALFVVRITDEELTDTQSKLLTAITRQDVVRAELERLLPIIQSGAVSGKRQRELEYELQQLQAEQQTLVQHLRGQGLPESAMRSVIDTRTLATVLEVRAPLFLHCDQSGNSAHTHSKACISDGYSIEEILVHPGRTVTRGQALCSLAYHPQLYIEGTAFDSDLNTLQRIAEMGWGIQAEMHHQFGDSHHHTIGKDLRLVRVDNHVDEVSQTVRFFLGLDNEIERVVAGEGGRSFKQWRFRPGQRIHLRLPDQKWTDQITLPRDAVVIEAADAFVFALHHHDDDHDLDHDRDDHDHDHDHDDDDHDDHDHDHHDHDDHDHDDEVELELLSVRVLHRDDSTVVLADDPELEGREIALNQAYKLHLAMKLQQSGGGGHDHHHDH